MEIIGAYSEKEGEFSRRDAETQRGREFTQRKPNRESLHE
jgi:hypothetical protein